MGDVEVQLLREACGHGTTQAAQTRAWDATILNCSQRDGTHHLLVLTLGRCGHFKTPQKLPHYIQLPQAASADEKAVAWQEGQNSLHTSTVPSNLWEMSHLSTL